MRKIITYLFIGIMLLSSCLFAQDELSDAAAAGIGIVAMLLMIAAGLAVYLFFAVGLMKIANKLGVDNAWFAFIPILNFVLIIQCADKPLWWIVLLLIPGINGIAGIVISILCWMVIAERLGKESWWGILIAIVPIVNFIMFGILAYGDSQAVSTSSY